MDYGGLEDIKKMVNGPGTFSRCSGFLCIFLPPEKAVTLGRSPMRIALVAPLAESVPPRFYGGTERVVAWLAGELVRLGHRVTLFATADSQTPAELVPCGSRGSAIISAPRSPCCGRYAAAPPNLTSFISTSTCCPKRSFTTLLISAS